MRRITYIFCGLLSCLLLLNSTTSEVKALEEEIGVSFYREDEDGGGGSEGGGEENGGNGGSGEENGGSGNEGGGEANGGSGNEGSGEENNGSSGNEAGSASEGSNSNGEGGGAGSQGGSGNGTAGGNSNAISSEGASFAAGSTNQPAVSYSANKLPQTGETGSSVLLLAGIILLAFTFLVISRLHREAVPQLNIKKYKNMYLALVAITALSVAGGITMPVMAAMPGEQQSAAEVGFEPGDAEGLLPTDPDEPEELEPVDPRPEDPEDPGPDPIGRDGLYLLITPKLDFGAVRISEEDAGYYAKAEYLYRWQHDDYVFRPNYLEVADLRGTNAGWKIMVTKTEQFTTGEGSTLDGAQIILRNGRVNSVMNDWQDSQVMVFQDIVLNPGETQVVMYAAEGYGAGRWYGLFGDTNDLLEENSYGKKVTDLVDGQEVDIKFNSSIILNVPGATEKEEQSYSTTLLWTVSDTP